MALSNDFTTPKDIKKKRQFRYLLNYLGHFNVKTILIEERYISRDFLHDYTAYYATCFEQYSKECKRVHLFAETVTEEALNVIVLSKDDAAKSSFWTKYLGNIVVKPIPLTVIGTTILKTYDLVGEFGSRDYWGLRDYSIHIFGTKVTLRSLAFQEQDRVLAACATTAIWSTLHKIFDDHQTSVKSPSQITRDAADTSFDGSRLFPNKGLTIQQICRAIERAGLVCEVTNNQKKTPTNTKSAVSNAVLKELVRAYSPIAIPIILIIHVPHSISGTNEALHALTLQGHRFNEAGDPTNPDAFDLMSKNIERLYAHDDQFGPFVRIKFEEEDTIKTPWSEQNVAQESEPEKIEGDFVAEDTSLPAVVYVTDVIISLYPKIRISYFDIKELAVGLWGLLRNFSRDKYPTGIMTDLRLMFSEQYKEEVKSLPLYPEAIFDFLTKSLPKFVWVVSFYAGHHRLADFAFDATGVKSAVNGIQLFTFEEGMLEQFRKFIVENYELFSQFYSGPNVERYHEWLVNATK